MLFDVNMDSEENVTHIFVSITEVLQSFSAIKLKLQNEGLYNIIIFSKINLFLIETNRM